MVKFRSLAIRLPFLTELDLCGCRCEDDAIIAFLAHAETGLYRLWQLGLAWLQRCELLDIVSC